MEPRAGVRVLGAVLVFVLVAPSPVVGQSPDFASRQLTIDHRDAVGVLTSAVASSLPLLAQEAPPADRWTGCYDVHRGEWEPSMSGTSDSLFYRPPPRVEFTDDSARSPGLPGPGWMKQRPAPGSLPSLHSISGWRSLGGDSVEVLWSSAGTSGVRGELTKRRDTLRGRFETIVDFSGVPIRETSARLVRVSCSATPDVPATSQRPVFRSVPLEDGDTVFLGQPVSDSPDDVKRLGARAAGGVFTGAELIRVEDIRGDTVREIGVRYPRGVDLDSLVAAWSDSLDDPVTRGEGAMWHNRTTDLRVSPIEGRGVDVMLVDPRYRIRHLPPPEDSTEAAVDSTPQEFLGKPDVGFFEWVPVRSFQEQLRQVEPVYHVETRTCRVCDRFSRNSREIGSRAQLIVAIPSGVGLCNSTREERRCLERD